VEHAAAEERLTAARGAFDRHEWQTSYELLTAEDAERPLVAADLVRLADAAKWVRIGVYTAEVTARDGDYFGRGVHEAARVATVAAGDEIVASEAALVAAGDRFDATERRAVQLKGLEAPVEVATVTWR
jgi:class 3 adenylate cyclase